MSVGSAALKQFPLCFDFERRNVSTGLDALVKCPLSQF